MTRDPKNKLALSNPRRAAFKAFLNANNLNPNRVATLADLPRTTVYSLVDKDGGNPERETEERIARALGVSVDDVFVSPQKISESKSAQKSENHATALKSKGSISVGSGGQKIPLQSVIVTHNVPVLGKVEAGAFREMYAVSEPSDFVPLDAPEYAGLKLIAYEVAGDSMDKEYAEGTRVICASPHDIQLRDEDIVVLRQMRHSMAETSLKQFRIADDGSWQFWPMSSNPTHKPIIAPRRDELEQDGLEVLAIVLFDAPKPRRRIGRPAHFLQKA